MHGRKRGASSLRGPSISDWLKKSERLHAFCTLVCRQHGALFESWVFSELTKALANKGEPAGIYFWRTHGGQEVDFLLERSGTMLAIEARAGMTVDPGALRTLGAAVQAWGE